MQWDTDGNPRLTTYVPGFTSEWFFRGWHIGRNRHRKGWIQQESTFWRRRLWNETGGFVDQNRVYAGDFELWSRFWLQTDLVTISVPLGGIRIHQEQKTKNMDKYYEEVDNIQDHYDGGYNPQSVAVDVLRRVAAISGRGLSKVGIEVREVVRR